MRGIAVLLAAIALGAAACGPAPTASAPPSPAMVTESRTATAAPSGNVSPSLAATPPADLLDAPAGPWPTMVEASRLLVDRDFLPEPDQIGDFVRLHHEEEVIRLEGFERSYVSVARAGRGLPIPSDATVFDAAAQVFAPSSGAWVRAQVLRAALPFDFVATARTPVAGSSLVADRPEPAIVSITCAKKGGRLDCEFRAEKSTPGS